VSYDASRPVIPLSLRKLMAEVGPRWTQDGTPAPNIQLMTEEFSKLHASMPDENSTITQNIPYGPHRRQEFDLFIPNAGALDRPVVIFVHGGAFVEGHRNKTPEFYSNVLRFFARHDIIGINMGYRMAPECQYPGASYDVGSMVAYAQTHATKLGIDPSRIFLMGHSAGGAHVGSYAYDRRLHPTSGPSLAGVIIISGRVRAETLAENPNARKVEAYYGTDPAVLNDASPVSHIDASSPPTFIAIAQFENALIDIHCMELAHRLSQAKRRSPPFLWLRGHNHTSSVAHLNTAENLLGKALLEFIDDPGQ
jgi:acetyl esterase